MSRREGRDSHGKRLHSRSERETSPKKSRRDGKPATEKPYSSNHHPDILDNNHREQKHRRRLHDALPLEIPPVNETEVQSDVIKESLDRKIDGLPATNKHSPDLKEVPLSQSFFQHDERGSTGHGVRSSGRRTTDHKRWTDPREQSSDRFKEKVEPQQPRADDNNVWRHDGFYQLEAETPPSKRRPAFREKKIEAETETAADIPTLPTARKEERGGHYSSRFNNKLERPLPRADERNFRRGDEPYQRGEMQRGNYQSRHRFGEGGMRVRDRFDGRSGDRSIHQPGGLPADKWKHDLFHEANRSPTPKNEDEQIAKVEALLAL